MTPAADFAALVRRMVDEAADAIPDRRAPQLLPLHDYVIGIAEKPLIELMLERNHGNQTWTAIELGINRNTLRALMRKHGIKAQPQLRAPARTWFGTKPEAFPA